MIMIPRIQLALLLLYITSKVILRFKQTIRPNGGSERSYSRVGARMVMHLMRRSNYTLHTVQPNNHSRAANVARLNFLI
jgi:hypothetical protein